MNPAAIACQCLRMLFPDTLIRGRLNSQGPALRRLLGAEDKEKPHNTLLGCCTHRSNVFNTAVSTEQGSGAAAAARRGG